MKQIDNLILCMTKEKPLERIRALEQKINEVEKISNLEDVINQIAYSGGYPFSISGDIRSVPS